MNDIKILFPKGKTKALTLSYDDGVWQDKRLIDILNRYGIKCTFNLNSSKVLKPQTHINRGVEIKNIPSTNIKEIYSGHEIATHGYTHPWFTKIHDKGISDEINTDRLELEKITGEIVRGHAYPFGAYDDRTLRVLKYNFICYARTTVATNGFGFPRNFLEWHPSCHHNSPKLFELLDKFLSSEYEGLLFYLWGHSYEFDLDDNWALVEEFCEKASGRDDIWYATNMEIFNYIQAFYALVFSADGNTLYNPSTIDIHFKANDNDLCVKSGETMSLK